MHILKSHSHRWAGLVSLTIIVGLFFSAGLNAQTNCSYYASPAGGGNGLSSSSPFQIASFYLVARPGDRLCLLDGTYSGQWSMISPPYFLSGTAENRITVSAIHDGAVLIDGQGVHIPIYLADNDFWTIEGVNARNSSADVVLLYEGTHQNIIRRVVGWDAADSNSDIFSISGDNNSGNLLEDVAAFGVARKSIGTTAGAVGTTIRRAWAMWNYSTSTAGPKETYTISYDSYNTTCENCIGTIDEQIAPDEGERFGILSMDRMTTPNAAANAKYLGSIAYVLGSEHASPTPYGLLFGTRAHDYVEYRDTVVYVEPGTHTDLRPIYGMAFDTGTATGGNRVMDQVTAIGGAPSAIDQSSPNGWSISNVKLASNLYDAFGNQTLWENDGSHGATVCFQYQNRSLTSTPLWPWPMNQRIIDAMSTAGRVPTDVTRTMENIFGSIPSRCGGSAPNSLGQSSSTTTQDTQNTAGAPVQDTQNTAGTTDTGTVDNGSGGTPEVTPPVVAPVTGRTRRTRTR